MEEWRLEKKLKETLPQGAEIADIQELVLSIRRTKSPKA